MADYNKFVFDEIRRIGQAWFDKNPQDWMASLSDENKKFIFEKVGEMSWRRLIDNKPVRQILTEIGVNPEDYGEPPLPPPDLNIFPRKSASIAALIVASACNIEETVKIFQDSEVKGTRVNLLSALWPEVDVLPYTRLAVNSWDLFQWNNQYFERLAEVKERCNAAGIVVTFTNYNLYDWSKRKMGPQQDNTPYRNNVNGIYWDKEDITFDILPDDGFSIPWFEKVCPLLDLKTNIFEIGNEFPEKPLHHRVKDHVRRIVPGALLQVNRQEDTPGQYTNMKIGIDFNFIAFHGRLLKDVADLDRQYPDEPVYQTFREFFEKAPIEPWRITFSSDGARTSLDAFNPYDWDKLKAWFLDMKSRGCSREHQSRAKLTPPPNHQLIEADWIRDI